MAKDVGAMQVKGGYIVIGVDRSAEPIGDMDGADSSSFDPANLVPKMQRYLHGSLDIATGVLTWDGHTVVLVCVKPNPRGCAFFIAMSVRSGLSAPSGCWSMPMPQRATRATSMWSRGSDMERAAHETRRRRACGWRSSRGSSRSVDWRQGVEPGRPFGFSPRSYPRRWLSWASTRTGCGTG